MSKRVAQMGGSTAQIQDYTGINKQLVISTDEHRIYVMDGENKGGHPVAMKKDLTDYLSNANAQTTYLTKAEAQESYLDSTTASETFLGKNETAVKATKATSAEAVPWAGITGKPTSFTPSIHSHSITDVSGLTEVIGGKAGLNSPTFTGIPLTPTPVTDDRSKQIANTEFVQDTVSTKATTLENSLTTKITAVQTNLNTHIASMQSALKELILEFGGSVPEE